MSTSRKTTSSKSFERHVCHHKGCGRTGYVTLCGGGATVHSCVAHLREAKRTVRWPAARLASRTSGADRFGAGRRSRGPARRPVL